MPFIDSFQKEIWENKYRYKEETYEGFCERIAISIFPDDKDKFNRLKSSIMDFRTLFGGRINSNIGIDEKGLTLFNCFIESTPKNPDSLEGIFEMITNYALTLKTEGGVGFCANFFRPSRTIIRKIGVTSPGPIKFLEIFDKVSEVITSGSVSKEDCYQGVPFKNSIRKGATMVTMSVNHPDIEDFITAKSVPNRLTKMNMSVLVTDAFMYAVDNDLDWDLWFPDINCEEYDEIWNGDFESWAEKGLPVVVYKTVKAKDLWEMLLKSSYCVPEDLELPVYYNNKLININVSKVHELVQRGENVYAVSVNKDNLKLEKKRITNSVCTGDNPLLDITTSTNFHYRCTAEHKLFGIDIGDPFCEIMAKNLHVGDYISVANRTTVEDLNSPIDDEFEIFTGLILGDGSVRKGQIRISVHIDQVDEVLPLLKRISSRFNKEVKFSYDKRSSNWVELNIYSTDLSSFLETFMYRSKFEGQKTSIKEIPSYLFTTTNLNSVRNFLSGYLSADGCINGQKTTYYTKFDHIAVGIQRLLLRIGVISRKYEIKHKEFKVSGFRVDIDFINSEKLLIEIPKFLIESKINRSLYNQIKSYKAPIKIMSYDETKHFSNKSRLYRENRRTDKKNFSERFHYIFDSDIVHEKIIDINNIGIIKTFDITVEDNENFICVDGGVYHNCRNEPGILFIDNARRDDNINYLPNCSVLATNPCQPEWATVLTKKGIIQFKDVNIGDYIWSEDGWVKILNKVCTGIKEVYRYRTNASVFYGTKNHRIVSGGKKVNVDDAVDIDTIEGENVSFIKRHDPQTVMDGLVLGGGSVHKASNNLIYLCIGENDEDYFDSEIKPYITTHRAAAFKEFGWEVKTNLSYEEVPYTYDRRVPYRYMYGSNNTVLSFLRGLYSANGTVICTKTNKAVRLKSASIGLVEDVQIMLSSLGIRSYIIKNKPTKVTHSNGEYESRTSYDINITKHTKIFEEKIGFIQKYKQEKLREINRRQFSNREKVSFDIIEKEHVSTEDVYSITVDGVNHTYWSGGCNVSNCGEVVANTGLVEYNGEIIETGDVCNLGSLVLPRYYNMETKKFDYDLFKEDTFLMTEALDNIIDISDYPIEMYRQAAKLKRKVGVGVAGAGSLLMMMGIQYGSDESVKLFDKILSVFMNALYQKSALLAKEKGPFALYSEELLNTGYVKNSKVLTEETIDLIRKHGIRNSALSALAPNGTLSILAGNVSGGLEPVFSTEFTRWNRVEGKKVDFQYPEVHKGEWFETDYFKKEMTADEEILLSTDGKYRIDKNQGLCKKVTIRDFGYSKALENNIPVTPTATELSVQEHLNILGVFAKNIDLSCSKTINLSADISFEDFKKLYGKIHDYGVKGCTTYREGTSVAVLETKKEEKEKEIKEQQDEFLAAFKGHENGNIITDVVSLPEEYPSKGYILRAEKKKWYIHVAFKDEAKTRPFAIFVNTNDQSPSLITNLAIDELKKLARKNRLGGKRLEDVERKFVRQPNSVKVARMLGYLFRHNVPIPDIVRALGDVEDAGVGTFVFRIKKFLSQFITEPVEDLGIKCDQCGSKEVILQEGCTLCRSCGSSKCS